MTDSWQSKIYSQHIGGIGQTVSGGNVTGWTSTNGVANLAGGTPPAEDVAEVLGRGGLTFDTSNTEHLLASELATPFTGTPPDHGIAVLFKPNTLGINQYLVGAGAANDAFRALYITTSDQSAYVGRRSGSPNRIVGFGLPGYFSTSRTYVWVISGSGDTFKSVVRPLDGSADSVGTDSISLGGSAALTQGVIGSRWINGAASGGAGMTLYEAIVFDDALTGDQANEAGGGEIWDVIDYLTRELASGMLGSKQLIPGLGLGIFN